MSSRSTSLEPKNLDLRRKQRKEIPNRKSGGESKKKEGKKIPDQKSEENRRNMQKGLRTRQYLNNTELSPSKLEKERKSQPKVVLSL